jgi:hypothetical protein
VPRPLDVKLDIAERLGYVGEQVPVVIKIKNDDDRKVYLRLSVFLPPNDDEQGTSSSLSTMSKLMDRSHCEVRRPRIDIAFTRYQSRPTRAFFKYRKDSTHHLPVSRFQDDRYFTTGFIGR